MSRTPCRTPAGSGRLGVRRSAAKSGLKRRGSLVARSGLEGITKNDIKRLARRGGVLRIANDCYGEIRGALDVYLRRIIPKLTTVAEYAHRHTITPMDVAYVLKQMGITTMYGEGMDWTYGFFTKISVRQKLMKPVPDALLAAAAAARADSEAGSTGNRARADAAAAAEQAAAEQAGGVAAAAAAAEAAADEEEGVPVATSVARTSHEARALWRDELQEEEQQQQQVDEQQQEEAAAVADAPAVQEAAAAAAGFLSPVAQQAQQQQREGEAAAAAKGGAAGGGERRLSCVPTPAIQPMSKARCMEIQGWLSDIMHGPLSEFGRVPRTDLKRVLLARHSVSAAEVQDVLFALEKNGTLMFEDEGGDCYVYLCSA